MVITLSKVTSLRKYAPLLFLLLLTCIPGQISNVNAQSISVALPDTFVTETQSVLMPVQISDVSEYGILSFEFTISYDSTILQIEEVVTQNGLASGFLFLNNLSIPGQVVVAAASVDSLKGSGDLFYLQASFLQDGSSEMNFERVSFEVDSLSVVSQNGRLRNVSLASTKNPTETLQQLVLSDNYPNPFSLNTTISMDLPEPAQVSIEIYNVNGQLKRSHPPRQFMAGANQRIIIEASSLPTGLYYYRVAAFGAGAIRTATGAMTIIH